MTHLTSDANCAYICGPANPATYTAQHTKCEPAIELREFGWFGPAADRVRSDALASDSSQPYRSVQLHSGLRRLGGVKRTPSISF